MMSGGMDPGMAQAAQQAMKGRMGGLASIFGNLFNDPRRPYAEGQRAYDPWMDRAAGAFNPFWEGGTKGFGDYQKWAQGMSDPQDFINKMMGGYQESPYAKYLQEYARRAGINAASASGLAGSTPYLQQAQENAANISSKDMQDWLSRVLGANTEYGQTLGDISRMGFGAAQGLGNIFGNRARDEAEMAFGKERAGQDRTGGIIGGLFNFLYG